MLGVVHTHSLPSETPSASFPAVPRYGSNYSHHFVLMEDRPPWTVRGMSAPWCFPSMASWSTGADECESVQFVMSLLLNDPTTLLMTYGVDDCASRAATLPLDEALALARGGQVRVQDTV